MGKVRLTGIPMCDNGCNKHWNSLRTVSLFAWKHSGWWTMEPDNKRLHCLTSLSGHVREKWLRSISYLMDYHVAFQSVIVSNWKSPYLRFQWTFNCSSVIPEIFISPDFRDEAVHSIMYAVHYHCQRVLEMPNTSDLLYKSYPALELPLLMAIFCRQDLPGTSNFQT